MRMLCFSLFLFVAFFSQAHAFDLKVNITNIKTVTGTIKVAVFPPNAGFPSEYKQTRATAILNVNKNAITHTFLNLPEDDYAIAIFHDVNNNDDLDTNLAGIPVEPFGFSNNPTLLGPPTFRKCKLSLDQNKSINIELRKLF